MITALQTPYDKEQDVEHHTEHKYIASGFHLEER